MAEFWTLGIMRHLATFCWSGIVLGGVLFSPGCKTSSVVASRPSDSAFVLFDACDDFYAQNRRWPKDFAELSAYDQQSKCILKHGRYDQVAFTFPKDGRLGIYVVSGGITNSGTLTAAPEKS